MFRVAALLSAFALIISCSLALAESESADKPESVTPCPQNRMQASTLAAQDVQKFKKMYYSGTWVGFLHQYKSKYVACPDYIKEAYIESARQAMNAGPPQVGPFPNFHKQ